MLDGDTRSNSKSTRDVEYYAWDRRYCFYPLAPSALIRLDDY